MSVASLLARLGVRHREHVSVARDFSVYSAVNVTSLVLLLATALMLRRYLGPYFAGIWTALALLPTYATLAHLGTLNAAERQLPFLVGARRPDDFERLKHTLFWLTHGLGATLATGVVVTALIARSRVARPTFVGLLLYAPIVWAQIAATYYVVLFRARRRFVRLSGRQGIANLIRATLLVACGYAFGLYGVLAAELVASLLFVVLLHGAVNERFEPVFDRTLLAPLFVAGAPILIGGAAFDLLRGADQIVVLATLGPSLLGVYSVTAIICQGLYYLPNALATVMYPRFQERYGETGTIESLRKFVELPLGVLADLLLAVVAVLMVALPPAIAAFFPQYVGTIVPLRVMLVGTYFLCLAPPAGQFLLTVHKETSALLLGLPATVFALAGAYFGSAYGLAGVATGVAAACLLEFLIIDAYAFAHLDDVPRIVRRLGGIVATAVFVLLVVFAIELLVPAGPPIVAVVGGWRLLAIAGVVLPLVVRTTRRIRSLPTPGAAQLG